MPNIDIGLSYLQGVPNDTFKDFFFSVSSPNLRLHIEERERTIYAGLEWLLPTAVFVFIGRSYFESFLKEMGKDHYQLLKGGIKALGRRLLGPSGPKLSIIASQGKISDGNQYSIVFSVMVQTRDNRTVKLLLRKGATDQELSDAVDAFMSLFAACDPALEGIISDCDRKGRGHHTVLVSFNPVTKCIELVDSVATKPKEKT